MDKPPSWPCPHATCIPGRCVGDEWFELVEDLPDLDNVLGTVIA